jgi:hypothetical protein
MATPAAWDDDKQTLLLSLIPMLFLAWITSDKHYWIILGERRRTGKCSDASGGLQG